MKVLHIIPNFSVVGGAEMMLSRLIIARPDCRHAVVALMNPIDDTFAEAVEACEQTWHLAWNGVNTLNVVAKLRKIIQQYQPDVVQSWLYHGNVLASLAIKTLWKKPKLVWGVHHSLASLQDESTNTKLALKMSKGLCQTVDAIVYCAHSAQKQHEEYGFSAKKSLVIANGIDLSQYKINEKTFQNDRDFIVGFAGRFHTAKGFPYLFQAIQGVQKQRDNVQFYIAGKNVNQDNPEIQSLIQQYHIDVNQLKFFDHVTDMQSFYAQLDVFLMTSITEGLPTVLIEAMASGVPCISTDVGDASWIVGDCGQIVPPRQPKAIENAILRQMSLSIDEQKQVKYQARQWVEQNFALAHVSEQYVNLWQSVCAK